MRSIVLAAVLGLTAFAAPSLASAQVAAASVPNSFDRPAGAAAAPAIPPATPPANENSEEVLRTIIAGALGEGIDYSLMTPDLAERMRAQEARLLPIIRQFGAVQAVDFVGVQNGADLYVVTFAHAATQWVIGFEGDKVAALLFRPAE